MHARTAADVLSAMDPRALSALNAGMPVPKALAEGDYSFLERELKIVQMAQ